MIVSFSAGGTSESSLNDSYKSIEVSEVKENLSNEIFKKLSREHYVKNFDKTDFNKNYINAVFKRLDEEKKYFIQNEVDSFIKESKYETDNFDIALAYKIINLYLVSEPLDTFTLVVSTVNHVVNASILMTRLSGCWRWASAMKQVAG